MTHFIAVRTMEFRSIIVIIVSVIIVVTIEVTTIVISVEIIIVIILAKIVIIIVSVGITTRPVITVAIPFRTLVRECCPAIFWIMTLFIAVFAGNFRYERGPNVTLWIARI